MSIKITKEEIELAVYSSKSMSEAAAKLKLHFSTFKRYAEKFKIYTPNQGGKGFLKPKREGNGKIPLNEILQGLHPSYQTFKLKHRLYEVKLKKNECEECNVSEWQGRKIECELGHKDGDRTNHKIENLRILCPNCHSLTPTFRSKNMPR